MRIDDGVPLLLSDVVNFADTAFAAAFGSRGVRPKKLLLKEHGL
jgi:hypothetical protein